MMTSRIPTERAAKTDKKTKRSSHALFDLTESQRFMTTHTHTHTNTSAGTFGFPRRCRECTASTETARNTPPPPWRIWPTQNSRARRSWMTALQWGWLLHCSWRVHTAYTDPQNYPERTEREKTFILASDLFLWCYFVSFNCFNCFLFVTLSLQQQNKTNMLVRKHTHTQINTQTATSDFYKEGERE